MADTKRLLVTSDVYHKLAHHKDARDKLAHFNVLTISEIETLFRK